jgi:hypothetical protein
LPPKKRRLRDDGAARHLFACNHSDGHALWGARIRLRGTWSVRALDTHAGTGADLPVRHADGWTEVVDDASGKSYWWNQQTGQTTDLGSSRPSERFWRRPGGAAWRSTSTGGSRSWGRWSTPRGWERAGAGEEEGFQISQGRMVVRVEVHVGTQQIYLEQV